MSNIVIYGPGGSGKSTLAASFCELGFHVKFIDADKKISGMRNLEEWIKEGRVSYIEMETSLMSAGTLKQRAQQITKYYPKVAPKGYYEICEILDDLFDNPPEDHKEIVITLDSFTRINEHLKRLIKHFAKKPKLTFDEWDAMLANYEELTDYFFNTKPELYAHRIMIAHSKDEYNDKGGLVGISPHIDGQFKDKLVTFVEEMWYTEVDAPGKHSPAKFIVTTKPVGMLKHARTSRKLKTRMPAEITTILSGEDFEDDVEEESDD